MDFRKTCLLMILLSLFCWCGCGDDDDNDSGDDASPVGDNDAADDDDDNDNNDDDNDDDDNNDDNNDDDDDDDNDDDNNDTVSTYYPQWNLFEGVLARLSADFWDESGNWDGDMMDDATTFAPEVLLKYGYEADDSRLIHQGKQTCLWELELVQSLFPVDPDIWYAAGMGAYALWWGVQFDVDPAFDAFYPFVFRLANQLLQAFWPMLDETFFSAEIGLGFIAHLDHDVARFETGAARQEALDFARELIDIAWDNRWNPATNLFLDESVIANGTMLLAMAEHAHLTGDAVLLERAEILMTSIQEKMLDTEDGGYWEFEGEDYKMLSCNLMMLRGIVSLYEATGNAAYRLAAEEQLAWLDEVMCHDGLCFHDWDIYSGLSSSYCTGCNFLLLDDMYHLHSVGLIDRD